jgi:hypothetical protein
LDRNVVGKVGEVNGTKTYTRNEYASAGILDICYTSAKKKYVEILNQEIC